MKNQFNTNTNLFLQMQPIEKLRNITTDEFLKVTQSKEFKQKNITKEQLDFGAFLARKGFTRNLADVDFEQVLKIIRTGGYIKLFNHIILEDFIMPAKMSDGRFYNSKIVNMDITASQLIFSHCEVENLSLQKCEVETLKFKESTLTNCKITKSKIKNIIIHDSKIHNIEVSFNSISNIELQLANCEKFIFNQNLITNNITAIKATGLPSINPNKILHPEKSLVYDNKWHEELDKNTINHKSVIAVAYSFGETANTDVMINIFRERGHKIILLDMYQPFEEAKQLIETYKVNGILIPGGEDVPMQYYEPNNQNECNDLRTNFELALLDYVVAHDIPTLAICRGLQILWVHQGGRLQKLKNVDRHDSLPMFIPKGNNPLFANLMQKYNKHLASGSVSSKMNAYQKEMQPQMNPLGKISGFNIIKECAHFQIADTSSMPPTLEILATANGVVEGVKLRKSSQQTFSVIAFQNHPEILYNEEKSKLAKMSIKLFTNETEKHYQQLEKQNHKLKQPVRSFSL